MDVKSQRILQQLNHLYATYPADTLSRTHSHLLYNLIYDHLKQEGHSINFTKEINQSLRKLAKIELNKQRKAWVDMWKKETNSEIKEFFTKMLDLELKKFYKTYFVRKYLYDLMDEGKKLELTVEGKTIKMLELLT